MNLFPLGRRATLFLPVVLAAISCERLPTTADNVAPSRPSFAVVPGSGSWTTKAPMPTARDGLGVAAVNGILYAVGGFNNTDAILATVEAYDPVTNTWTTKAPMPTARRGLGVAAVNGILYAVGGVDLSVEVATVEAYDPVTNTWTTKAPMPTPRYGLGVGAVNGILYAVGGINNISGQETTVEAYDPATNTWTTKAPMPTGRADLGVAAVNGLLYAVGGSDGSGAVATVEAYDPVTNTWTTQAPMPTPRRGLGVAAVNGLLYAVGGLRSGDLGTLEAYDPFTAAWTTLAPMPTKRKYLGADGILGTLYAVGGNTGTYLSENEAFNPLGLGPAATLTLSPLTATNTVGTQHCVTATVQDAAGSPVPGVTTRFSVGPSVSTTFPSPSSGSSATNTSGQATFCYTASLPGVDQIHAFGDVTGNGTQDPTEPFGDAENTWTPPGSTQLCEVTITDAGWIIANNNDRANFGGNAKVLADGTVQGQQRYKDQGPVQPMSVQSTEITATTCSQDRTTATIYGKATIDGTGSHVFRIDVSDAGRGGSNDTYGIRLDTGYMSGQHRLGGGNITIH